MGKVNGILLSWAPKGVLLYAKPYVEMNRLHAEDVNNKSSVGCQFCPLRKWLLARMPERIYMPVRPLVLIYNSMV